jgi:hypothetical protein
MVRAAVGDTILVRLAGAHVTGAVLRAKPRSSNPAVLAPIPDPECPDPVGEETLLRQAGLTGAEAHSLAQRLDCQAGLFADGEAFAAFRAVAAGAVDITAPGLDPAKPPFAVHLTVTDGTNL